MLCEIGRVSKSSYYTWLNAKVAPWEDIIAFIKKEQLKANNTLGYRRMKTFLLRNYQISIGANKLRLIMAVNNMQSIIRRKRRKSIRQKGMEKLVANNILKRDFNSNSPNKKYVTDITYIPLKNTTVYFSAIVDIYNGEVVATHISTNGDKNLSLTVVEQLAAKRNLKGALLHSDQGIHYTNKEYNNLLKEKGIIQSMSRKGNCWDNAMAENFFSHYKTECVRLFKKKLHSVEDVQEITDTYIEYYNNKRYKAKLNNMAPVEYRLENF